MLVLPTTPFSSAVIVDVPGASALNTPRELAPLFTVTTEAEDEVHFTAPVTFWVVPSANVPVAVSCSKVCAAMVPLLGSEIFKLTSGDEVTSRVLDPLTLPRPALIVVVPGPPPVASPQELTLASDGELELQVAVKVTACEVPSLNCPVAVYCTPVAGAITKFCGATSMLSNSAPVTCSAAAPVLVGPALGVVKPALISAVS